MQDFTKILSPCQAASAPQTPTTFVCYCTKLFHHPQPAKGQCQQRQEGGWTQQEPRAGAQTCSLGAPLPSPGMHRTWGAGRQQRGSARDSQKQSTLPLFSMPWTTEVWVLLLVTLMRWMSQRNLWLQGPAGPVTGFALGAHLKCIWCKETWQEPCSQSLSHTPLVLPSHAAASGSV